MEIHKKYKLVFFFLWLIPWGSLHKYLAEVFTPDAQFLHSPLQFSLDLGLGRSVHSLEQPLCFFFGVDSLGVQCF